MAADGTSPLPVSADQGEDLKNVITDSSTLLELSSILNASLDLEFILGNILLSSMGKLLITKGVVLVESRDRHYSVRTAKGLKPGDIDRDFVLPVHWKHFLPVEKLRDHEDSGVREFYTCCIGCDLATLVPMILKDRVVGIVGLGGKITKEPYTAEDITFLESVAAVAASAVNNALRMGDLKNANRRLDSKIQEMNTLFELSREMNTTFDVDRILQVLSYALMGQLRVHRYLVFVHDGTVMQPVLKRLPKFKRRVRYHQQLEKIDETIVFTPEHTPCSGLEKWLCGLGISVLIPMRSQKKTRGMICLGERVGGSSFEKAEIEYLSALSNITISALENARLFQETVEKQRLEKELSLARAIQKGLLPKNIPDLEQYEIVGTNESSQQVGGDYFDVIPLSDHEYILAIGDVAGKGIPASLLMANVQAALRTIAPLRLSMPESTARINTIVHDNTSIDKFITFFWAVLNTREHTLEYVNAGHNPPYHLRANGEFSPLSEGGLILGVLPVTPAYESAKISIQPGDVVAAYTDGVNEAMSKDMNEFGDQRLTGLLQELVTENASAIVDRVRKEIIDFTTGATQSDDITMLVLKRSP